MQYGRLFLSALVVALFSFFFGWLTCGWLFTWVYSFPPAGIIRDMANASSAFWVVLNLGNFVTGIIYTFIYSKIGYVIGGGALRKGLMYGVLIWFVSLIPGMFYMYMTTNIGWQLSVYWLVRGMVELLVIGCLIAWIYPLEECECCK